MAKRPINTIGQTSSSPAYEESSSMNDFDDDKIKDLIACWENCPDDILLIIFQYLDIKSLINCMLVNNRWRDIVDYQCQHCRSWQKMVEDGVPNKGITFKEKSFLEWRDILFNCLLWYNVKNSTITIELYHTQQIKDIKSIKVYKDNLIVVYNDAVKYLNTINMKLTKTVKTKCLAYEESEFLIVKLTLSEPNNTGFKSLSIKTKLHLEKCDCNTKIIANFVVYTYKLHSNSCYVLDIKNVLWLFVAKPCISDIMVLAKYFGNRDSISSLHVYESQAYIILKRGDVLRVDKDSRMFEKVCHIEAPVYFFNEKSYPFQTNSVLFGVDNSKCIQTFTQKQKGQVVMALPGLTCATEHGDVLFLGYENGKIEIHIISKMLQSDNFKPEIEFNLRKFTNSTETNLKIAAIEVFEECSEHYVFVATDCNIYQILIT